MEKTRRISAAEVIESRFYQLPKWLVHDEAFKGLNSDAKILYSIIRDRHDLSLKNNWIDEDGNIYMIYTRQNMCDDLGISEKTVTKSIGELKKYKLIDEVRQGCNKPNILYLLTVSVDSQLTRKKCVSENVNIPYPNKEILRANDTNVIDTYINDTDKEQENVAAAYAKNEIAEITSFFKDCFNNAPTKQIILTIAEYKNRFTIDCIYEAMKRAGAAGKDWSYALGIIKSWDSKGLHTLEAIEKGDIKKTVAAKQADEPLNHKNKFAKAMTNHNFNHDNLDRLAADEAARYTAGEEKQGVVDWSKAHLIREML